MEELEYTWIEYLQRLDIAFQPIVSLHSGKIYGVEALLRGVEAIGFGSIGDFFDQAYALNILYTVDLSLREKVIQKFTSLPEYSTLKLFINLDNRLLAMPNFAAGNTAKLLKKYQLPKETICFEISERHEISNPLLFEEILHHYKEEYYSIAIDDFGVGVSGYQMLYRSTPDIIKIDRFFFESICRDMKKKILVRSIVQLATQLGITVIAEGVETESEMLVSKELGCHLIQGYFVQHPTLKVEEIMMKYRHVKEASKCDRRRAPNKKQIKDHIEKISPIYTHERMNLVLQRFKDSYDQALPVVGADDIPLGVLDKEHIRELISSPYGHTLLLKEPSIEPKAKKYVQKCAMADIHTNMDEIIESYANYKEAKGVLITKNMKYYGFLSASSIIAIINERNLISAQDQNPLTKMPGNRQIDQYISKALTRQGNTAFTYFDLNDFKAYNDNYGFRNGDRVIQMFSNVLQQELPKEFFSGHIGGDDFFTGVVLDRFSCEEIYSHVKRVMERFSDEVRSMYCESDRERGFIIAKDRQQKEQKFDLLSVSAAILQLNEKSRYRSADSIHQCFAVQKKSAKTSLGHVNFSTLL